VETASGPPVQILNATTGYTLQRQDHFIFPKRFTASATAAADHLLCGI